MTPWTVGNCFILTHTITGPSRSASLTHTRRSGSPGSHQLTVFHIIFPWSTFH